MEKYFSLTTNQHLHQQQPFFSSGSGAAIQRGKIYLSISIFISISISILNNKETKFSLFFYHYFGLASLTNWARFYSSGSGAAIQKKNKLYLD
jgi:predicted AlkP superfamily pyrophosphatase or phosphodiesterase